MHGKDEKGQDPLEDLDIEDRTFKRNMVGG
jgi:hypothetical protein